MTVKARDPEHNRSLMVRGAHWALQCALRHWPEETREWGTALAAEIGEATNSSDAVRWTLGGIMLFARSVFSSAWRWMKLPTGGSFSENASAPNGLPKRSRLFTVAVLMAAAGLLLLPEGREAVATAYASWNGFEQSRTDRRALHELAERAEREQDPTTLAFVALSSLDRRRSPDVTARRFLSLADKAVALNPKYAWIYSAGARWPVQVSGLEERLEQWKAVEPENAAPDLMAADAIVKGPMLRLVESRSATDQEVRNLLAGDAGWMALMNRAFSAPEYESPFLRQRALVREVWSRHRTLSPAIAFSGLFAYSIPNLSNMETYAQVRTHDAEIAFGNGDAKSARASLEALDSFGARMRNGNATEIEKLIGLDISRTAIKELAALNAQAGDPLEAKRLEAKSEQLESAWRQSRYGRNPIRLQRERTLRRSGVLVQLFALLSGIAGLAALVGILGLELWPARPGGRFTGWRKAASRLADYAPMTLLAAGGAFLLSFLPYAHTLEEYRSAVGTLDERNQILDVVWGMSMVPNNVSNAGNVVLFWYALTATLSLLAVFVVARSVYCGRRLQRTHR